jgi:hypothetical protein
LLFKNNPPSDSPWYERSFHNHGLLRVLESVRAEHGDEAVARLYFAFGERIHDKGEGMIDPAPSLAACELPAHHANAMTDESFDAAIRSSMDEGLALTGNDVGTPILAFENNVGKRVGFFGPVISRRLNHADALQMWDGIIAMAGIDSFWELKRTRTESPNFTPVE